MKNKILLILLLTNPFFLMAQMQIVSNLDWKVGFQQSGPFNSPVYDVSDCTNEDYIDQICGDSYESPNFPVHFANCPGMIPIWGTPSPASCYFAASGDYWFHYAFDLDMDGDLCNWSAIASIQADQSFTLYINDNFVGSSEVWQWNTLFTYDVLGQLLDGNNDILIRTHNIDGGSCFNYAFAAFCLNIVTDVPAMTVNFNTIPVDCFGNNTGSATAVVTGAAQPVVYSWSNGANSQSINNITAGNYCLTVSDANGCLISNCVDITEAPELNLSGTSTATLCANGNEGTASVIASGGAPPYLYLWPNGQVTATAAGLMAGNYVVTVVDNYACQETLNITVADAANTINLQTASTATTCFNINDGTATVTASGGMGSTFAYQWDNNAGLQTTAQAINLLPGSYCVTVIDNNNCTETECVIVGSPPALVVNSITPSASSCFGGDDGSAFVQVSGGTGTTYTYVWDDANAQFSNPANNLTAGTYTVTISDSNNCTTETSVTVTEPALLNAVASGANISCFGENDGTATVTPSGGTAPYNYYWSNGQTSATATNLSAGQQLVTVTDDNGCTTTAMTVLAEPASELSISVTQTFVACFEADESSALVTATGGTATYTYLWSNGAQTAQAVDLAPTNYSVNVTDANGCSASALINISELTEITINVATVEPDCFGEPSGQLGVNIVDGGVGGGNPNNYTYQWTSAGIPNQNTAYINNVPGGQDYFVTVTDAQGCSATATTFLDQPDPITFLLQTADVACNGSDDGSITVTNIQNAIAPYEFQWSPNAGGQTSQTINNLFVGIYNITLTDAAGCMANNSTAVGEPDAIVLAFDIENNLCAGTLEGAATVQATGGAGAYNYSWSNGATTAAIENLGTGMLTVTVTDGNDCEVTEEITISQPPELSGIVEGDTVTCFGDQDGRVLIMAVGGTAPYLYQFNEGELNGTNSLVGIAPGTYPVFIQDVNGCTWETEVVVASPPPIEVWPGADRTILLEDLNQTQIILTAYPYYSDTTQTIGNYEVSWYAPYSGTLICSDSTTEDCERPTVNTQHTTTYTAYVVDENGCEGQADITITVIKRREIYVPTAFTPNGDGVNNILLVHGQVDATIDVFRVFDRWGTLVYEARDFQANDGFTGWDGSFKGKPLNPGTFVWYLEASYLDGYQKVFKGQTTLIR